MVSVVVDSWSCPTTIYAGAGALGHLAAAAVLPVGSSGIGDRVQPGGASVPAEGSAGVVLLTDARLWPGSAAAEALTRSFAPAEVIDRSADERDEVFLQRALDSLAAHPAAPVLALGGGSVLDVARLAALARVDAGFAEVLTGPGSQAPLRMWPGARNAANSVVCIPTTLGTAAEVSPIAVLRRGGRTQMFAGPGLRARAAVLDPAATAGHRREALLAGLVEPLSRVLVPAVTGAPLPLQDALAAALVQVLLDLGDAAGTNPDADWRLTAALTSSQTHTAFLGLGRSPFGHALWPFATEVMAAIGVTKAAALAMLVPPWLRGLAAGVLGPAFGSAARVRTIVGMPPDEAAQSLAGWFGRGGFASGRRGEAGPGGSARQGVAAEVAAQVRTTWQATGFFLSGATAAEIDWLSAAALAESSDP